MSSETLAFREYLEMLCIELADFKSLAIPVRMELLSGFRQQQSQPPPSAAVAAPKTPSPPAERSALTADSELEIISRLPQGKQLDILTRSPAFLQLAEILQGPKYERLRADFPKKEIRAAWFRDLPSDQRLALERLYACVAEKRMIREGDEMSVNYLFKTLFSDAVLEKYEEFIRAAFTRGEGLSAITYRKSYFSLVSLITSLSGRHNSNVEPRHLASVMQARRRLLDHADSWNKETTLASNLSESDKILRTMTSTPPERVLTMLYFLLETQKIWFDLNFSKRTVQEHESQRALGFTQFALLMARPVSRAETLVNLTLATVQKQLREPGTLCWTFEETKVASTFGSLLCCFPEWLRPILKLYISTVRPVLLKAWGNGSKCLLFPQGLNRSLERFLNESCQASVNPSVIRQKCCEAIGLIAEDSPYYKFRQDLQYTAQHKTSSQVVEKHYALSNKPSREGKLMEYIQSEFHAPAIQMARDALCAETSSSSCSSGSSKAPSSAGPSRMGASSYQEEEAGSLLADLHNDAGPESDELPAPVPRVKTVRTSLQPSDDAPTSVRLETAKHGKTAAKTQATIVSESTSDDDVMLSPRCAKTGNTPATNHKNQPPSESVRPDATAEDEAHVVVKEKLPSDFEEAVKKLTVQAFRVNYLFGQTELNAIISTALLNADATVKASFDEDNLRRLATRRIRGYVKNWVNTMPQKKFVKELVEKKLPATIASVKQVASRVNIDKMLSKHHAFRSRASDETIRKIQKDTEQRWVEHNEHARLEEKQGPSPDQEGDFAGIIIWRRNGMFECKRFEEITEQPGDSELAIARDYSKHTSRKKKRKLDCSSPDNSSSSKKLQNSDDDSAGGRPDIELQE